MEVKVKTAALAIVGIALLSYATGRYMQPAKVVTKIVTETKEIVVVKNDVQTVTHEVDHPDGTVEKTTTTVDKSQETIAKESRTDIEQTKTNQKPQWLIGAQLTPQSGPLGPVYGAEVQRRIIGPIFVGAFGNTNRTVGLSVSIEL